MIRLKSIYFRTPHQTKVYKPEEYKIGFIMGKAKIWCPLLFAIGLSGSETLLAASCEYEILNEWGSGFTGQVTIVNDSTETLNGWSVSWSYTDGTSIPHAWNAALSGSSPYVATNLSYNSEIGPGASTTFGFNGYKANQGSQAQVPELGGICSPALPNQAPVAVASATPRQGNVPLNVRFDATGSSDPENANLSYLWDFGNGETSTNAVVSRTFDREGSYSVSLTVNDGQLNSPQVFTTIVATEEPVVEPEPTSGYVLDSANSSLYFVSTKRIHALETHKFTDMYGAISDSGEASLNINLSSVETGIPLRNQRARDLLFEVGTFSEAVVTLPVNLANLTAQAIGSTQTESISATLDLHGVSAAIDTEVSITKLSDSKIMVQNVSPILIKAGDYDLERGVDALRAIANLSSISYTVPVNFTLLFNTPQAQ